MEEDNTFVIDGPESDVPLPSTTLGLEIYISLCKVPRRTLAMVDALTGKSITYGELLDQSCNLAQALRLAGYMGQNVTCGISSENSLQFFVAVFASLFNGCIVAPVNHSYTKLELDHMLRISQPRIVFCSQSVAHKFVDMKKKLNFIERIILIGAEMSLEGTESSENFVETLLGGRSVEIHLFCPFGGDSRKMISVVLSSSGTTGLPKGVMLSHLNCMVLLTLARSPQYFNMEAESILGLMPFFHGYGFFLAMASFSKHKKIIVFKHFDEDVFLKSIQDYKIATLHLAPPLMIFLAKTSKLNRYDLSSVNELISGAAPLSKTIQDEVKRRLNCKSANQSYGLTESTIIALGNTATENKIGSCGKVMPFVSCKVRDSDTGKSLGPNQPGEICLKGPTIMMGYHKNENATKEAFTSDGWLRTGDIGYYDNDGFFFVIDRIKELIKYQGYQVAPAEIEALLVNHEKVQDVAVVGLPDESVGEKPLAFIVKKKVLI